MRYRALMRYYQSFPTAIPRKEAGSPRVTHPSATKIPLDQTNPLAAISPFDLHVLGTPPAFILSQDQTLMLNAVLHSLTLMSPSRISFRSFDLQLTDALLCFLLPNFLRSEDLIFIKESSGLHFCSAVAEFSNLPATTQRF